MNGETVAKGHGSDVERLPQRPGAPLQLQIHVQVGEQRAQVRAHGLSSSEAAGRLEVHDSVSVLAGAGQTVEFRVEEVEFSGEGECAGRVRKPRAEGIAPAMVSAP